MMKHHGFPEKMLLKLSILLVGPILSQYIKSKFNGNINPKIFKFSFRKMEVNGDR